MVNLSALTFANGTGVDLVVTLEAPPGVFVFAGTVLHGSTKTFPLAVPDVQAARVIVDKGGPHESSQDFEVRGSPQRLFIETLAVHYPVLGSSIHGRLCARSPEFPPERTGDHPKKKNDKASVKSR